MRKHNFCLENILTFVVDLKQKRNLDRRYIVYVGAKSIDPLDLIGWFQLSTVFAAAAVTRNGAGQQRMSGGALLLQYRERNRTRSFSLLLFRRCCCCCFSLKAAFCFLVLFLKTRFQLLFYQIFWLCHILNQ